MAKPRKYASARYQTYKEPGYFTRHWRGELSLRRSYWLNAVIIGGGVGFAILTSIRYLSKNVGDARLLISPVLGLLLAFATVRVWADIGVWRSARQVKLSGRATRATIVQLFVLIGLPSFGWYAGSQLWMLGDAVRTGQPMHIAQYGFASFGAAPGIWASKDGTEIDFSGPITDASTQEFERAYAEAPNLRLVRLSSGGGLVVNARIMSKLIRARNASTEVDDHCESACTIVFFSGRERTLKDGAKLGFHSYSVPLTRNVPVQAIWEVEAVEERAFEDEGVPPWFISRIFSMPASGIWYPNHDELTHAGFVTKYTPNT